MVQPVMRPALRGCRRRRSGLPREGRIGPDATLLVDCHSRLSPVMARIVLREAGDDGLYWLEEPLDEQAFDPHTARSLRSFANDRGIRIAGGEQLASMESARDFLARGAFDAILPDMRWTGIRTGMAVLELAAASGVGVSLHNPVGPVLDCISIQVAAALPSLLILERQVRESPLFDAVRGGSGRRLRSQRARLWPEPTDRAGSLR
jgi:galactonate dehydratase